MAANTTGSRTRRRRAPGNRLPRHRYRRDRGRRRRLRRPVPRGAGGPSSPWPPPHPARHRRRVPRRLRRAAATGRRGPRRRRPARSRDRPPRGQSSAGPGCRRPRRAGGRPATAGADRGGEGRPSATWRSRGRSWAGVARLAGSLTSRRARTGVRGPSRWGRRGWPLTIALVWNSPPPNGGWPSTANHRVAPSAHGSVAGLTGSASTCSGPCRRASRPPVGQGQPGSPWTRAMPKSASLVAPSSRTIVLGEVAVTIRPAWSAPQVPVARARPAAPGRRAMARTSSSRVGADTSSMTMKSRPVLFVWPFR